MSDTRFRLIILGGFLGSGKTTWLRHQLFENRFGSAKIIVNEAAGTPVDDAFLGAEDVVEVLADGCACCDGASRFQATLLNLCDQRSKGDPADTIVLETSGLADPAAIIALIQRHPVLVRQIIVSEVIVVVDTLHVKVQLERHALAHAQIAAADRLVLTKADQTDAKLMAQVLKTLPTLAPSASLSLSAFGNGLPTPIVPEDTKAFEIGGKGTQATPIRPVQLDLGDNPDWTALALWLSALLHARGDTLVRAKGVIQTPAGRLLLQAVRNQVQSPEILPAHSTKRETDNTLVLIGQDLDQVQLARSFAVVAKL